MNKEEVHQKVHKEKTHKRQVEQRESSSSLISNDSNPTLASLRSRIRCKKIRSLQEIYDQGNRIDLQSNFSLFAQDPIYFEDAIEEKIWIDAIND